MSHYFQGIVFRSTHDAAERQLGQLRSRLDLRLVAFDATAFGIYPATVKGRDAAAAFSSMEELMGHANELSMRVGPVLYWKWDSSIGSHVSVHAKGRLAAKFCQWTDDRVWQDAAGSPLPSDFAILEASSASSDLASGQPGCGDTVGEADEELEDRLVEIALVAIGLSADLATRIGPAFSM